MELQCPIKRGIKAKLWYAKNVDLKSLADFWLCETQAFGQMLRDYAGEFGLNGHNGIDIAYEEGTEVFASHNGIATAQIDDKSGLGVIIKAEGYKTIYWHLKEPIKPIWSSWAVKKGDLIGWGDSTGWSTGHHLHYGLKLLDINGNVLNRNNGFDGAIDPRPYIVWWNSMDNELVKRIVGKLYKTWLQKDTSGVDYWSNLIDSPEKLENFIDQKLSDIREAVQ